MILEPQFAWPFIDGYKQVLLAAAAETEESVQTRLLQTLVEGRSRLVANPQLAQQILAQLQEKSIAIDPEVTPAILSLQVKTWIYLRDARTYSIWIDPSGEGAYGVVGLTDRIRDIIGGTGAFIEAGLVRYRGRFVCDGLISQVVWLGRNYKQELNGMLAVLKAKGKLRIKCEQG